MRQETLRGLLKEIALHNQLPGRARELATLPPDPSPNNGASMNEPR
jgi:hypothetical protein